jgi:molybdopterin molybdotransferase
MSTKLLSYAEAHALVAAYARKPGSLSRPAERVELACARGRVLAQSAAADLDQPPFARTTRDGFACQAEQASSHEWLPIAGATQAGQAPGGRLQSGTAWEIMTGAPMPAGADAVAMIEHCERQQERVRLLESRTIRAGDNVVAQGAQARAGDELIAVGTRIGPAQIALAAACGYEEVEVAPRPRVAILATGDELVAVGYRPGPGQIRNSNGPMLAALVAASGGEPLLLPVARDTAEALDAALAGTSDADMLLISGGVSAGKFDLVEPALARLGVRFHFTGVRIQPGKPLVFAELPRLSGPSLPIFGLPGNPISSAATFLLFAAQVLAGLSGDREIGPRFVAARLDQPTDQKSKPGLTRFLPGRCGLDREGGPMPRVSTIGWHGSGDLPAFARANCFVVVPEQAAGLEAGAIARVLMI